MTELEVGQKRIDAHGDVWEIRSFGTKAYIVRERDGKGKTVGLRAVGKMALAPRRIMLTITPATATHCQNEAGDRCPFLVNHGEWLKCAAFDYKAVGRWGEIGARLPECIAAEVK